MDVGDFIVQIPPQLLLMTCGSGVLLIAVWSFLLWRRANRKSRQRTEPPPDIAALGVDTATSQPAADGENTWTRLRKTVHNFFFYSEEEKTQQDRNQPAGTGAGQPMPEVNAPPDTVEVMRIWRDVVDGTLIIQIGGENFRAMPEIRQAGQERRFLAILRDLARIAKEMPLAPAQSADMPSAAFPEAESAPVEAPQPEPVEPAAPPPQVDAAEVETVPAAGQGVPPHRTPTMAELAEAAPIGSFFDNVRKAIRTGGKSAAPGQAAAKPVTIAEQIEEYLQYKLTQMPEFQGRNIHVRQGMHSAVLIQVDSEYYETVDEIKDEAVQTFVRGVIGDWQEHH